MKIIKWHDQWPIIENQNYSLPWWVYFKEKDNLTCLTVWPNHPSTSIPTIIFGNSQEEAERLRELPENKSIIIQYPTKYGDKQEGVISVNQLFSLVGEDYLARRRNLIQLVRSPIELFDKLTKD